MIVIRFEQARILGEYAWGLDGGQTRIDEESGPKTLFLGWIFFSFDTKIVWERKQFE